MNLISVDIFRNGSNCSLNGISSKVNRLFIPSTRGNYKLEEVDRKLVFIPEHRGGEYWALKHIDDNGRSTYGGCLVYSSDSRCERVYHLHDRYED
jgi:hypothetical protein